MAGSRPSPGPERYWTFHSNLTHWSATGDPLPVMAQKIPSIQDGDWKVNPDGTMVTTWKIRPDIYWHDGTKLTAQDFVFGFEVALDPRLTVQELVPLRPIASVEAPDAQTLVINWKQLWIYGNSNAQHGVPALPRQQVEARYRSEDPVAFDASAAWRDEFIGLGPFKVVKWDLGNFVEAQAFDQYFQGRPKIDKITFKFVADVNVEVAQFLAGAIDVGLIGSMLKPTQLTELRNQWGPGKGMVFSDATLMRMLQFSFRVDGQPWDPKSMGWADDKRFRQAMFYAIDRKELVDVWGVGGYAQAGEYLTLGPDDPVTALARQRNIPTYQYDLKKATQLFSDAGWNKAADGMLRNSAGQTVTFVCCRLASADSNDNRESLAWGQYWKTLGMDVIHPIQPVPAGLAATDARKAGLFGWGGRISNWYFSVSQHYAQLIQSNSPNDANRWTGSNGGGYLNVSYDKLFDQRMQTLAVDQRREVELQLVAAMAEELPVLPVYYNPLGLVARDGITGFATKCGDLKSCAGGTVLDDAVTLISGTSSRLSACRFQPAPIWLSFSKSLEREYSPGPSVGNGTWPVARQVSGPTPWSRWLRPPLR
ncbi:MAG: hypothetical protein EXR58_03065 [Chloroflexi bacterium]|nr:hypothetical protein [Chloroflexota bacterium]